MNLRVAYLLGFTLLALAGPLAGASLGQDAGDRDRRVEFLRRYDSNGDGRIERSEVTSDRGWSMIERMAERGGMKAEGPLDINQLASSGSGPGGDRGNRGPRGGGEAAPGGASTPPAATATNSMAFDAPEKAAGAPGFDQPLSANERQLLGGESSGPAGAGAANSASGGAVDQRTQQYANWMLQRYDANKNGRLERDEWKNMRGDPTAIDSNRDGTITADELVASILARSQTGVVGQPSADRDRRGPSGDRSDRPGRGRWPESKPNEKKPDVEARKSYRFATAHERLPKDTPRGFLEKDENLDGQVSMAEFASSWNDRLVGEFTELDSDGNGLITAEEAIAGKMR